MMPSRFFEYWFGKDLSVDRLHQLSDLSFEDCGEIAFLLRRFRRQRFYLALVSAILLAYGCYLALDVITNLVAINGQQQWFLFANPFFSSVIGLSALIYLLRRSRWTEICFETWLNYLDNKYDSMNHSGDLLARRSDSLNPIEKLQKQRTKQFVSGLLNTHQFPVLPEVFNYPKKSQFIALLAGVTLFSVINVWRTSTLLESKFDAGVSQMPPSQTMPVNIDDLTIQIEAPVYTGIGSYESRTPAVQIIQGSRLTWTLTLNQEVSEAVIEFSDGSELALIAKGKGTYETSKIVSQTQTYRFNFNNSSSELSDETSNNVITDSLYTIEAINDRPPVIRVETPQKTITQVDMNAEPTLSLDVQIFDDFGLENAHILASIAKGSGEAVKFRDLQMEFDSIASLTTDNANVKTQTEIASQTLDFTWLNKELAAGSFNPMMSMQAVSDTETSNRQVPRYQLNKQFDLTALEMEPGDELYFTVVATDNRSPDGLENRSRTYILRWLDEDNAVVLADGMVLDILPEYFKSQRQIIIETKQLIADNRLLSTAEFNHTSKQLGFAQGDLKVKYGQYLGDEYEGFDEGGSHDSEHSEDDDHDDHDHQSQSGEAEAIDLSGPGVEHGNEAIDHTDHGHSHQSFDDGGLRAEQDLSGANELISTFGHAHEGADVGVYSALDPKALMKMALSFMWQAELELMLHRPDKALPHEEQALVYLTRAQKADRIYVKRLGFEPPPVNEERRYQGDLSDIEDISEEQTVEFGEDDLTDIYQQMQAAPLNQWNDDIARLVNQVQHVFNQRLEQQPELIRFVSMSQKLQAEQSLVADSCESCWQDIKQKLHRMLPESNKSLFQRRSFISAEFSLDNRAQISESNNQQGTKQP